jgi:ESCRT-II complex subunit VPS25
LVLDRRGEWTDKEKSSCFIYWNTPEEWAALISKWIFDTGKTSSVITLYEIIHGDESVEQGLNQKFISEFHECNEKVILKAIDVLKKEDKVTLFNSSDGNIGLKFT